jgi:uncharacterized protein
MRRAVLLAGGWAHPGHDQVAAVSALLAERSFETRVVRDPADVPATLDDGCDLLVVAACWFSMTDERYTDEQRRDHAVVFSPALDQALAKLRNQGCPVLALHTAVICFDGHAAWADWLGGTWNWTTSWHPQPGPILVQPADETPIEFPAFTVLDELYQGLDLAAGADIVAHAEGHPLVWLQATESGRAAVNLLGHDHQSLAEPNHRQLNGQLLDWLLRN